MISIEQIKQLREETEVSISEVKKALDQAGGDTEKAKEILKVLGKKMVGKKADRETNQGIIETYLHSNSKTGVLLDIRCESDFVAKGPDFKALAHEICLQIAAMKPLFVSEKDIPADILDNEIKIFTQQVLESKKPEAIAKQIIEGKLKNLQDTRFNFRV